MMADTKRQSQMILTYLEATVKIGRYLLKCLFLLTPASTTKLKLKVSTVADSRSGLISEIIKCAEAYWSVHEIAA